MKHSFSALGVSAAVEQALAARGMVEPFYIQSLVLPDAIAGRDILAKSPTGSGKTLAFGVPLVERVNVDGSTPEALVLVPTRELAIQVAEEVGSFAKAKGLQVGLAYGGTPVVSQAKRLKGAHVVVATPGRLQDLIERKLVSLAGIRILVLDEADRMLDMGFRPQVEKILRSVPKERQTMLFSATLDGEVGELADSYTEDPARFEALREISNDDGVILHDFVSVTPDGKVDTLVELLGAEEGLSLVFVRTKRGADRLVKRLAKRGVEAAAMHGDKSQSQREKALRRFHKGQVAALVATDVAARGIDVDNITQVVNFDAPEDRETYVHRTGRTGRAGRAGVGVTFVMQDQARDVGKIAHELRLHAQFEQGGFKTPQVGSVRHGGRRHPSRNRRRAQVR